MPARKFDKPRPSCNKRFQETYGWRNSNKGSNNYMKCVVQVLFYDTKEVKNDNKCNKSLHTGTR